MTDDKHKAALAEAQHRLAQARAAAGIGWAHRPRGARRTTPQELGKSLGPLHDLWERAEGLAAQTAKAQGSEAKVIPNPKPPQESCPDCGGAGWVRVYPPGALSYFDSYTVGCGTCQADREKARKAQERSAILKSWPLPLGTAESAAIQWLARPSSDPGAAEIAQAYRTLMGALDSFPSAPSWLLWGPPGGGKSLALAHVAHSLRQQGLSVILRRAAAVQAILHSFPQDYDSQADKDKKARRLEVARAHLRGADILILDELDKAAGIKGGDMARIILTLLDERSAAGLTTIAAVNEPRDLSEPIYSRLFAADNFNLPMRGADGRVFWGARGKPQTPSP